MKQAKRLTGACIASAGLLLTGTAEADTIFVPANFPTIQAAIDAANPGDEILVTTPGTYPPINFLGKAITVRSLAGPEITTIDAGLAGSVVECLSGEGPDTVLEGFTLTGGMAAQGAGMHNDGSSPTVRNCWFVGNTATSFGGGMHNDNLAAPTIIDCRFLGNTAPEGGGLCDEGSSSTLVNCAFSGNTANTGAGISSLMSQSNTMLINCAFSGNLATAGGVVRADSSTVSVANSILWNNLPEQISEVAATVTVDYCLVQGGWTGAGTGNLDADPLFADADGPDNVIGTADDDLRVQPGSPCIDAGDNTRVPPGVTRDSGENGRFLDDLNTPDTGNPDGVNPIVDLGSYEYTCVWNVTAATCHPSIQDAVDLASDGDELVVAAGTYFGVFNLDNRSLTLRSSAGPEATVLDADGFGGAIIRHIFGDGSITLEGFTLTGGLAVPQQPIVDFEGDSILIRDCIITGNSGLGDFQTLFGVGIGIIGADATLIDCLITANTADDEVAGLGLFAEQSTVTMMNCTISDNVGVAALGNGGGGAYFNECTVDVTDCVFSGNDLVGNTTGGGLAGGALFRSCTGIVADCSFTDNVSGGGGGMAVLQSQDLTFSNCAFDGNRSVRGGAGAVSLSFVDVAFTGCWFTSNTSESPGTTSVTLGGAITTGPGDAATLTDCTFSFNNADLGGAIWSAASSLSLHGCIFTANSAEDGAAFYATEGSHVLDDCTFDGNLSVGRAGAVYLEDTAADLSFCDFDSNVAGEDGGALYQLRSTLAIDQSLFTDNIAGLFGGAISNAFQGDITLSGCSFIENSAGIFGGALRNSTSDPLIDNCTFVGNSASVLGGGAIHNFNSDPIIQDSDFELNATDGRGGAVLAALNSDVAVTGCTFTGNSAEDGGAMANDEGTITLIGCLLQDNVAEDNGGALFNREGTLSVDACAFGGNLATLGAAAFNDRAGVLLGADTIGGSVFSRGSLSPGAVNIGALVIDGDYAQVGVLPGFGAVSGNLQIEMAGPAPGTGYDTLLVTGTADLGGGLFVGLLDGFEPQLGQSFDVLGATSTIGVFDAAFFPGLPDGKLMRATYAGGAESGPGGAVSVVVESLGTLLGFDPPLSESIAGLPAGVAVGDFDDADGPDLAITIPSDTPGGLGTVLVLLNGGTDGAGDWLGFASSSQYTVGVDPAGIATARLDGNLSLDLAVVNAGDAMGNLLILANDGSGGFAPLTSTTTGTEPRDVAAADFNGDGIVDLAVANAGDGTVVFLDNDGTGTMALTGTVNTGLRPESIYADILDEDKCIDVVAGNALSGTASVMINQGGGAFGPTTDIEVGSGPADVITGDLNGDGLPEIITANLGDDGISGTVSVIVNEGGGTFSSAVSYPVGDDTRSVTVVDLELDGDIDIAVVADDGAGVPAVQVLRNDTPANEPLSFADADDFGFGDDPVLVTAGDLDGDGAADLIAVNAGLGAFAEGGPAGGGPGSVNVLINQTEACPADVNGDGEVDVDDLVEVIVGWGVCPPGPCVADVNVDGTVNVNDLVMVITAWGMCGTG